MSSPFRFVTAFCLTGAAVLLPAAAQAYTGPTLGLGIVGSVLAILAVLLLSLFAFVVQPLRRRWGGSRGNAEASKRDDPGAAEATKPDDGH